MSRDQFDISAEEQSYRELCGFVERHIKQGNCDIIPLRQDASKRRYFRVMSDEGSLVLMDCRLDGNSGAAFVKVNNVIQSLGVRVPEIIAHNYNQTLALLEDLGDVCLNQVLSEVSEEEALNLYKDAAKIILDLSANFSDQASDITGIDPYNEAKLWPEAELFIDWYLPYHLNINLTGAQKDEFRHICSKIFKSLDKLENTIVLRDYHVDNLMIKDGELVAIDFQDALIGSPIYDILSLLEDVRRDVSLVLRNEVKELFFKSLYQNNNPNKLSEKEFLKACETHYQIFSVQRNLKILGIFVRLNKRDGKATYLKFLPRTARYIKNTLEKDEFGIFKELNQFLKKHDIKL